MDPYEFTETHLGQSVPYATHVGVEIASCTATARLEQRRELVFLHNSA